MGMLSCAGADRLQTGMRHAFGKPQGLCARVSIGQPIISIRTAEKNRAHAIEACRRAMYKILESPYWGFTKVKKKDYPVLKAAGRIIPDGSGVKFRNGRGPIKNMCKEELMIDREKPVLAH